ncbi:MAG TPA: MFS transporter, partial [Anaerolineales bacterium]|nr:MFS transporter [Anaerolineales bacterium]
MDFPIRRPNGMRGFYVIWGGQMISGIASNITFFALPIWILNMTDISGGALGLWESFYFGSYLLIVLFAGVFIDRYSRKRMMLVYDFLSLSATAILLVLQSTDSMEVWHLYVAAIFQGIGFAFHSPSYSAAITTLVPRRQYVRANGLMSLLYDAPEIFGPVLAGVLYLTVGLSGILALNLLAFVVSIGALLFVEIPPTPHTREGQMSQNSFWTEAIYGIQYILRRPGLLGIQLIFFFGNFFSGIALSVTALFTMILLRSGDASAAGSVQSLGALAAVVAGVFLSTLGGIKRPIRAILIGWVISSLFGLTLLGVGQV